MRPINFTLLILSFLLTACNTTVPVDEEVVANTPTHPKVSQRPVYKESKKEKDIEPGDPRFRPVRNASVETIQLPSGSLFNPHNAVDIYQASSQYSVGDMVLVQVDESTSANKSINYKSDKKGSFELKPVSLNIGPIGLGENDLNADYEQTKDFNSEAKAKQKNSLKGDITVYVTEVRNNGNLIVAGEKWITLNTGEEFIRFSGEIRSTDISLHNTISSVKVGNAHIEYSGVGEMQDNQDPSLIGKIFSILD